MAAAMAMGSSRGWGRGGSGLDGIVRSSQAPLGRERCAAAYQGCRATPGNLRPPRWGGRPVVDACGNKNARRGRAFLWVACRRVASEGLAGAAGEDAEEGFDVGVGAGVAVAVVVGVAA